MDEEKAREASLAAQSVKKESPSVVDQEYPPLTKNEERKRRKATSPKKNTATAPRFERLLLFEALINYVFL